MISHADDGFKLGDLRFHQVFGAESQTKPCEFPEFILVKTPEMVEWYIKQFEGVEVNDLLELGVLRGGSVAFFNEYFKPARHMAVDIHATAARPLAEMSERARRDGRNLLAKLDISQADTQGIVAAYEAHFGRSAEFDVIIDDASHFYDLSVASFNGLFPLVRPGGIYVIEDWGWGQWAPFQSQDNQLYNEPALTNLVHYCMLGCTGGAAGIARVDIVKDTAFVHRNSQPLPPDFRIESAFSTRGRSFPQI